jgi:hypothetical protein
LLLGAATHQDVVDETAEPPAGPVTNKRKVATVTLRVASLDGITHNVTVPAMGLVRGVKRVVGQVRV